MSNQQTVLQTAEGLVVKSDGMDKAEFLLGGQGDFYISNPARNTQGRAFAVMNEELHVNFANDFANGIVLTGKVHMSNVSISKFEDLQPAPAGVNTFDLVIDAEGNLYKKD